MRRSVHRCHLYDPFEDCDGALDLRARSIAFPLFIVLTDHAEVVVGFDVVLPQRNRLCVRGDGAVARKAWTLAPALVVVFADHAQVVVHHGIFRFYLGCPRKGLQRLREGTLCQKGIASH